MIKTLIVAVAIPVLIQMIKNSLLTSTRGFVDETMAGLANNFSMACPNCKHADTPWYPGTQLKPKKITQKKTRRSDESIEI